MAITREKNTILSIFGGIAFLWLVTVDLLGRVPFGPVSASGALTLATAMACLLLWPMSILPGTTPLDSKKMGQLDRTGGRLPWPLALFAVLALTGFVIGPTMEGAQNIAAYIGFLGSMSLVALNVTPRWVDKWMSVAAKLAVIAGLFALVAFATGSTVGYSERAFGMIALVYMAILIPARGTGFLVWVGPLIVVIAAVLSLSRTSTVICAAMLVLLTLRQGRGIRPFKTVALLGAIGFAVNWLITSYAPFRERFTQGDGALQVGGLSINTSGRTNIWDIVITNAGLSPVFGHGPGSSSLLLSSMFPNISHPHNDYIRIYHDFGVVGLVLFVVGMLVLFRRVTRKALADNNPVHWSASIGIVATLLAAFTDNVFVYAFVMVPLGIVVGLSLGLPAQPKPMKDAVGPRGRKRPSRYRV